MAQYVDISLDKARRVRFTINAVRELERHFGRSFGSILTGGASGSMGFEEIVQMLTVGLKYGETEKRALPDSKVGDLLQRKWLDNGKELAEVVELLMEAMQAAGIISKKDEDDDESSNDSDSGPRGGVKDLPNV
jgi:hypothetical protein